MTPILLAQSACFAAIYFVHDCTLACSLSPVSLSMLLTKVGSKASPSARVCRAAKCTSIVCVQATFAFSSLSFA
jgi:hypothetical protein